MDSFGAAVTLFLIYFFAGATATIISAEENSTVSLPCSLPEPATNTYWYKWSSDSVNTQNPLLSDYQLVNITQNSTSSYKLGNKNDSSALVINNYSSGNDSGYYYCKKEISDTKVLLSCPTLLITPPGPESPFLVNPASKTSLMYFNVALLCTPPAPSLSSPFLSPPSLSIHWTKGNTSINTTDGSKFIMADGGNLYIIRPDLSDSGLYQCIATDTVRGIVYKSNVAQLTITGNFAYFPSMPQFQIKPHNRTVLRGQSTQFECISNGYELEWSRPDHPSFPLTSTAAAGSILELKSVSEEDGGLYRCSAGSGMMQIQEDVYLTVIDEFNISLSVSSFYPSSGSILTVQCLTPTSHSLTGRINVTIQVGGVTYHNPAYHNGVFTQDVYVGYEEGQVVSVQCIGVSEYGYCDEETLSVIVNSSVPHESVSATLTPTAASTASSLPPSSSTSSSPSTPSPTPVSQPVIISTSPKSTNIMPGQEITLTCYIKAGFPLLIARWTIGQYSDQQTQNGSIHTYILTVNVSEPGNYICEVFTSDYKMHTRVSQVSIAPLTVRVPQDEVTVDEGQSVNLTCLFNYRQSLMIVWSTGTAGLLTNIHNEVTPNGTVSVLMLSSLDVTDAAVYNCFAAITSNHSITGSVRLTVNYLPPSSPPLDVKAEWMPSLPLLLISWSPPASNDSSLLGYKINWDLSSRYYYHQTLPKSARGAVPYTTGFFTINNLIVKETYLISVWAYGLGGDGPSFNLKKFLPESQLPSPTSSSSIAVTTTISLATPTPSVAPSASYELECIRITSLMGGVRFNNTQSRGVHHYSVRYSCLLASNLDIIDIPAIANGLFVPLYNLTPGQCWVTVYALAYTAAGQSYSVLEESCVIKPSPLDDHISVGLQWINGSVLKLSWFMSSLLSSLETDPIVVEWRKRNSSTISLLSTSPWSSNPLLWSLNEHKADYVVEIRIKIGTNVIHTLIMTPPSPFSSATPNPSLTTPTSTPQSSSQSTSYYVNPWLTYGIGIALLVFVCCLALLLVLTLKYVQTSRREIAKVSDKRHASNKPQAPPPSLSFYSHNKRPVSVVSYDSLKKPLSAPSPPLSFASSSSSTSYSERKVINIRRIDTDV